MGGLVVIKVFIWSYLILDIAILCAKAVRYLTLKAVQRQHTTSSRIQTWFGCSLLHNFKCMQIVRIEQMYASHFYMDL